MLGAFDAFAGVPAPVPARGQLHAEAEIRWHDEFAKTLAALPADDDVGDLASALAGPRSEGTEDSHGDH